MFKTLERRFASAVGLLQHALEDSATLLAQHQVVDGTAIHLIDDLEVYRADCASLIALVPEYDLKMHERLEAVAAVVHQDEQDLDSDDDADTDRWSSLEVAEKTVYQLHKRAQSTKVQLIQASRRGDEDSPVVATPTKNRQSDDPMLPLAMAIMKTQPLFVKVFTGDMTEYPAFRAHFRSIEAMQVYQPCEMLNILLKNVSGAAARALQGILPGTDHYSTAWAILEKRFGDVEQLVLGARQAVCSLPPVPDRHPERLRGLADAVSTLVAILESTDRHNDLGSTLLVQDAVGKLPHSLQTAWLRRHPGESLLQFHSWLEDESRLLNCVQLQTGDLQRSGEESTVYATVFPDKCANCGNPRNHPRTAGTCKAINIKCYNCNTMGHFAKYCPSPKREKQAPSTSATTLPTKPSSVAAASLPDGPAVTHAAPQIGADDLYSLAVGTVGSASPRYLVRVGEVEVPFRCDTGADVSVVSRSMLTEAAMAKLHSVADRQFILAGTTAQPAMLGSVRARLHWNNADVEEELFICDFQHVNLLSERAAVQLGIVQMAPSDIQAVREEKQLVRPITLEVDPSVTPRRQPARRVAPALYDKVVARLGEMADDGVIEPATGTTGWISPVQVVQKPDGSVRICGDYRAVNRAIVRPYIQLPTVDELFAKLGDDSVTFSKLDLKWGFWNVPLVEASRDLTTLATPIGLRRFTRLPFGISSAPELFHETVAKSLQGLDVIQYQDDILISGSTQDEHDSRLKATMDRLDQHGFKLNMSKCIFSQPTVTFLGHLLSREGIQPDPCKVDAVLHMPDPVNVPQLRTFLGIAGYLRKFVPHMALISLPLTNLLHSDVSWFWGSAQADAAAQIKRLLTTAPILRSYDVKQPVSLEVDASGNGLGAVVLQPDDQGRLCPVVFLSRCLTEVESRYATIEREALAVIWALHRAHEYVLGVPVTVYTDHKPLLGLFNKSLNEMPLRIQRWSVSLQLYNFKLVWKKGSEMHLADPLSRMMSKSPTPDQWAEDAINTVKFIQALQARHVPVTLSCRIANATPIDATLSKVIDCVSGVSPWTDAPAAFRAVLPQMTVSEQTDGVHLLFGTRLVVPVDFRTEVVSRAHDGHVGSGKTKELARQSTWWPGQTKDIEIHVANCDVCKLKSIDPPRPLQPTMMPAETWSSLAMDFFDWDGSKHLVVVDYYSRWAEVIKMTTTTAAALIDVLEEIFTRYGYPQVVRSDNGPPFQSDDLRAQLFGWEVKLTHSTPYMPSENGLAERTVRTIKSLLRSAQRDGLTGKHALRSVLRVYRSTIHAATGVAPARLFRRGRYRSKLASVEGAVLSGDDDEVRAFHDEGKAAVKAAFDVRASAKEGGGIQVGDRVHVYDASSKQFGSTPRAVVAVDQHRVDVDGAVRDERHLRRVRRQPDRLSY